MMTYFKKRYHWRFVLITDYFKGHICTEILWKSTFQSFDGLLPTYWYSFGNILPCTPNQTKYELRIQYRVNVEQGITGKRRKIEKSFLIQLQNKDRLTHYYRIIGTHCPQELCSPERFVPKQSFRILK